MLRVAIIGGGLIGASVARRLLELGANVTLCDRADAGQATAAGAGLLPPHDQFIGVQAMLPLLAAARRHYPQLAAALGRAGHEAGYAVVGALQVATSEAELAALEPLAAECERRREAGFAHIGAVTLLSSAQARSLFPVLGPEVRGALHCSDAARVDARRLLASVRARVGELGGALRAGDASLWISSGRVCGVRVGEERVAADVVVVAAGAWSRAVIEPLGVDLPVQPQRGQLLHLELAGQATDAWPLVIGFAHQYLLGFPGSRLVAGATREEVGHDPRATLGGVHAVMTETLRLAPALRGATLRETRVGFRPLSADRMPLLGPLPGVSNLFVATGHGGYGLEVGPYSGALLAELIAGQPLAVDLAPFAPGRFAR